MYRYLIILLSLGVATSFPGCKKDPKFKSGDDDDDSTDEDDEGCDLLGSDEVKGLDITAVDIYQGTRIQIMENGQEVNAGNAPVIAGKGAVIRIHVLRQADWEPRDIYARVELDSSLESCPIEVQYNVNSDSSLDTLTSTINVDIPAEEIISGLGITVSLREASDDVDASGNSDAAVWPSDGSADLDVRDVGIPLEVVLVPVRYNFDGSGRLPETGESQIELYEDEFYTNYPIPGVNITVLEPFDWSAGISAYGGGWGEMLNAIMQLRSANGAGANEYYYGVFAPSSSFEAFCQGGCITGLCNLVEDPSNSFGRACIGLGYAGEMAAGTMIHEVGHAHGRSHAPSGGAQGVDYGYPYSGGLIGVHGYDIVNSTLKAPNSNYDFMGYENPSWVSDYTYDALYDRVTIVNQSADWVVPPDFQVSWSSLAIGLDGEVTVGPDLRLDMPPVGREHQIELLGTDGTILDLVTGIFSEYDHLEGGLILFPEPSDDVVSARLDGCEMVSL
jgi:hypothetical protein